MTAQLYFDKLQLLNHEFGSLVGLTPNKFSTLMKVTKLFEHNDIASLKKSHHELIELKNQFFDECTDDLNWSASSLDKLSAVIDNILKGINVIDNVFPADTSKGQYEIDDPAFVELISMINQIQDELEQLLELLHFENDNKIAVKQIFEGNTVEYSIDHVIALIKAA